MEMVVEKMEMEENGESLHHFEEVLHEVLVGRL